MIDYDNRTFSPVSPLPGPKPVARYHQSGPLVWGEFSGGWVRRGCLTGLSSPAGRLRFSYCMVMTDGEIVAGRCDSVPEILPDGRLRLTEQWQRFGPPATHGVSVLEEVRASDPGPGPPPADRPRPGG